MKAQLRVVQGTLFSRSGRRKGVEVPIAGPRFLIGAADDCQLRCQSKRISDHHCELLVAENVLSVRDLQSDHGTFVNGERVDGQRALNNGDRLRVGRLEFDVCVARAAADPVSDFVSNLLVEADEEERARRMEDPTSRHFELGLDGPPSQEAEPAPQDRKKRQPPPKRPPAKLPPPPKYVADNTSQAAQETLDKILQKPKRPGRVL